MAATATPTIFDPQQVNGALSTTLTTTLLTAAAEAGCKITAIVVCVPSTSVPRALTFKANGRFIANTITVMADGVGVDILKLIGCADGLYLDASNTIAGGQDAGTDCDYQISFIAMKD